MQDVSHLKTTCWSSSTRGQASTDTRIHISLSLSLSLSPSLCLWRQIWTSNLQVYWHLNPWFERSRSMRIFSCMCCNLPAHPSRLLQSTAVSRYRIVWFVFFGWAAQNRHQCTYLQMQKLLPQGKEPKNMNSSKQMSWTGWFSCAHTNNLTVTCSPWHRVTFLDTMYVLLCLSAGWSTYACWCVYVHAP